MRQRSSHPDSDFFGQQVRSVLIQLVLEHLPLGISGAKITDEIALDILLYADAHKTSIEQAALKFMGGPSANTVREQLRKILDRSPAGLQELENKLNRMLQAQLPPNLRRHLQKGKSLEVAGDLTDLPYHGEPDQSEEEIRRSQAKSGTTHFHSYATLQIVNQRQRVTVAVSFVRKEEKMEAVVKRLLATASGLSVRIRRAYFDKGFASVEVFRCLRQRRIPYLIAVPARGGDKGLKRFFYGWSKRCRYTFYQGTKKAYTTDLIIVRKTLGKDERKTHYFAYAIYRLGSVRPHQIYEMYRRRFGIETGYRQVHQVQARTSTRNPALRLLFFGLSLLLVNYWVLYRQISGIVTLYGNRLRVHPLTLEQMTDALVKELINIYGEREVILAYSLGAMP